MSAFDDYRDLCEHRDQLLAENEKLTAELSEARRLLDEARELCGAAYQAVGAADGPEEMLDNLSDAASGRPLRHAPAAGLPWVPAPALAQPAVARVVECKWSPDTPDACPYCSGEACAKCGPDPIPPCRCDVSARHERDTHVTTSPAQPAAVCSTCNGSGMTMSAYDKAAPCDCAHVSNAAALRAATEGRSNA